MGKYRQLIDRAAGSIEYWAQIAMRRFVVEIDRRMRAENMSRASLAEKLEASPAYVTKAMRGDVNFTLETMTKLALAVGGKLQIDVVDRDAGWRPVEWHCAGRRGTLAAANTIRFELPANHVAANHPRYDYRRVERCAA